MNQTQIMTLLLPKEAVQPMFEITQTTELISGVKHLELAKQTLRLCWIVYGTSSNSPKPEGI